MAAAVTPAEINAFWFEETDRENWFKKNEAFDQELRARFGETLEVACDGGLTGWEETLDGTVALILVLDQFSRNLFRGSPRAFEQDARALALARGLVASGRDRALDKDRRLFIYLPFEHSEHLADQERCVALMADLDDPELLGYAIAHRDVIARFGRFPHRNAALGRQSTAEEAEYLSQPGAGF